MNCMKCGKELEGSGAFCPECLAVMERYPVKPGTKVMLPQRSDGKRPTRPVRRQRSPEEIVLAQRKTIRRLRRLLIVLLLLLAASVGVITWRLSREQHMAPVGSNYSTVESTAAEQ